MKRAIILGMWVTIAIFTGVVVAFMTMPISYTSTPSIEWINTNPNQK